MFESIKEAVTTAEVAERYGIRLAQKGRTWVGLCPFHADRHPSLAVYDDGGYICWSCGAKGGDVVSFVAQLYGFSQGDAARRIEEDFGLPSDIKWKTEEEIGPAAKRQPTETDLY